MTGHEQHTPLFPPVLGRVRGASPPLKQKVDLRYGDPPCTEAFADHDQRDAFLARREASRAAQQSRYAVSLGCQVRLPDGSWLTELAPVDASQLSAGELRDLLQSGHTVERYDFVDSSALTSSTPATRSK